MVTRLCLLHMCTREKSGSNYLGGEQRVQKEREKRGVGVGRGERKIMVGPVSAVRGIRWLVRAR